MTCLSRVLCSPWSKALVFIVVVEGWSLFLCTFPCRYHNKRPYLLGTYEIFHSALSRDFPLLFSLSLSHNNDFNLLFFFLSSSLIIELFFLWASERGHLPSCGSPCMNWVVQFIEWEKAIKHNRYWEDGCYSQHWEDGFNRCSVEATGTSEGFWWWQTGGVWCSIAGPIPWHSSGFAWRRHQTNGTHKNSLCYFLHSSAWWLLLNFITDFWRKPNFNFLWKKLFFGLRNWSG